MNLIYNFCFFSDNLFNPLLLHGVWRSFALIWKTFMGKCFLYSSENVLKIASYFQFASGESFIEFQLILHKSVLYPVRIVQCITLLWVIISRFSLWIFDKESRETNTGKWSDTSLLMTPFLSFNKVSKTKCVNILSIKENVFDVTLVGLLSKECNHVQNLNCKTFESLNFRCSLNSLHWNCQQ